MLDATKSFTLDDQHAFARISGDFNPMHLDALYARRTQAAEPAVHGIHGMLWALEEARVTPELFGAGAKVRFESFLYLDQVVELRRGVRGASRVLELVSGARAATSIALDVAVGMPEVDSDRVVALPDVPNVLTLDDVADRSGAFALGGSDEDYAALFPHLAAALGARRVRAIGGLSTLVGMVVPGLHSIFSKCEVALVDDGTKTQSLAFRVLRTNPVLRTVAIAFCGGGIAGRLDAFVRTPPVAQASVGQLASRCSNADFAGRRALVVGGSRGLGELTAKMLAVRGGAVTVTYLRGREDAERVAAEIRADGYAASAQAFDTGAPDLNLLQSARFTDVFYFATPPIFARRLAGYDEAAAERFTAVYCHQFAHLSEGLAGAGLKVTVFWPSSTALDDNIEGLTEYSIAKAAGEKLCELLQQRFPNLRVLVRRLPRLDTDQTASVIPVKSESAETVMGAVLDAMAALRD